MEAFLHAWSAYKKYAWGHDELKPISKSWQEWMGIGLTIVDSIDTMYIMGLQQGAWICILSSAKEVMFHPACLSVCLSVRLSVCLPVCLSVSSITILTKFFDGCDV